MTTQQKLGMVCQTPDCGRVTQDLFKDRETGLLVCCYCKYGEAMRVEQGDRLFELCPQTQCSSPKYRIDLEFYDRLVYTSGKASR